jgi:foldase protein PrsA
MKKRNWFQPILWTAFWGLLASCALPTQAKLVDEVALVVDQEAMTKGELEESIQAFFLAQRMSPAKPGTPLYEKAKQFVVEGFIREVLMAEEGDRMGIVVSDVEVDRETDREVDAMKKGFPSEADFQEGLKHEGITLDDLRSDIRTRLKRRIKANRAMRQQTQSLPGGVAVTDEEAREHFAKDPQSYEQVKFAVILFRIPAGSKPEYVQEVDKQAQGVLAELKGGADFAVYARKYSEEKGSSDRGGAMGTFYRSELDPKLAKGIFTIPEKGMGIVRAPEGFYIVRVDKKQKADYALVAKDIKDSLQKGGQEAGLQRWFEGLKKNAFITLDGKPYQGSAPSGALRS